jgi:hypothetical protein
LIFIFFVDVIIIRVTLLPYNLRWYPHFAWPLFLMLICVLFLTFLVNSFLFVNGLFSYLIDLVLDSLRGVWNSLDFLYGLDWGHIKFSETSLSPYHCKMASVLVETYTVYLS